MSAFQNVCPTRHEHILFRIKNAVLDDKQADDLLHFFILGETLILGFYRDWAHQSPFIYRIYICVLYYIYTSCTSTFNTLLLIHIHQVQPERRSTEGIEHFPFGVPVTVPKFFSRTAQHGVFYSSDSTAVTRLYVLQNDGSYFTPRFSTKTRFHHSSYNRRSLTVTMR